MRQMTKSGQQRQSMTTPILQRLQHQQNHRDQLNQNTYQQIKHVISTHTTNIHQVFSLHHQQHSNTHRPYWDTIEKQIHFKHHLKRARNL